MRAPANLLDADAAEIERFCKAVGEMVLWAAAIDAQLTKAVIYACVLTDSPMLEPIVSELDVRAKAEILRARSKHFRNKKWATSVENWTKKAEKTNGNRNIVAHHQVALSQGRVTLFSPQARKLLRRIKGSQLSPAQTVDDINQWIEAAKSVYVQGQNLLTNLMLFAAQSASKKSPS